MRPLWRDPLDHEPHGGDPPVSIERALVIAILVVLLVWLASRLL